MILRLLLAAPVMCIVLQWLAPALPTPAAPAAPVKTAPARPVLWKPQGWGNPATVAAADGGEPDAFTLTCQKGPARKAAVAKDVSMDIRKSTKLIVRVTNRDPQPVGIAVALKSMPGWKFYESRVKGVAGGLRDPVTLTFDLQATDFKSEETKWQHKTAIQNPQSIHEIVLMVYPGDANKDAAVTFNEIRLDPAPAAYVEPPAEAPKAPDAPKPPPAERKPAPPAPPKEETGGPEWK